MTFLSVALVMLVLLLAILVAYVAFSLMVKGVAFDFFIGWYLLGVCGDILKAIPEVGGSLLKGVVDVLDQK